MGVTDSEIFQTFVNTQQLVFLNFYYYYYYFFHFVIHTTLRIENETTTKNIYQKKTKKDM